MPAIASVLSQMFPGKPKWSVDEIPDLSGKVMLVTGMLVGDEDKDDESDIGVGGNTGIGRETVKVYGPTSRLCEIRNLIALTTGPTSTQRKGIPSSS